MYVVIASVNCFLFLNNYEMMSKRDTEEIVNGKVFCFRNA